MRFVRHGRGLALSRLLPAALALTGAWFLAGGLRASGAYDTYQLPGSGEWAADNPAQRLRIVFDGGVTIGPLSPAGSLWEVSLGLSAYGYESALQSVPAGAPRGSANRIDEDRAAGNVLSTWYVNDAGGLQQWIRLEQPLAPDWKSRTERIVFDFSLTEGLKPVLAEDHRSIELQDDGRVALRYGDGAAYGSDGAVVPLHFELRSDAQGRPTGIRIVLERGYVAYPLTMHARLRSAIKAADAASPPASAAFGTAPTNDTCGGAPVIPDGPYPVLSTVTMSADAATSAGDPQASCVAATENGIWYKWTPAATQVYTLSTCANATATTPGDGVLAVYTSPGCFGPFTETGCNDDACDAYGPSVIGPQIFQGGTTYYILASHYPISEGGGAVLTQYQVRIDGPSTPPANDLCGGAEVVPAGGPFPYLTSVTQDARGATTAGDPPVPPCQADVSRSLWYTFTPAASSLYTIESCESATATTLEDTVIAIYTSPSGSCDGPFTPLDGACDDDACDTRASVTASLAAGTRYHVLVWQYGSSPPPSGSTAVQLRITPISAPSNDACSGAAPLLLDRPIVGTVAGAANDYVLAAPACFYGIGQTPSSAPGRDAVYAFTSPAEGLYSFRAQDLAVSGDLVVYVSPDCPAATPGTPVVVGSCWGASNRNGAFAPYAATEEVSCLNVGPGQTVFVFVDRSVVASTGGAFRLEASRCRPESEPNQTPASASALQCGTVGSITTGDVDYFALGAPLAGARIFALADGAAGGSTDFDMRATTAGATLEYDDLNADTPFGSLSPVLAGTKAPGGAAYLRLSHYAPEVASEPYRLYSVVQCPSSTATSESEPNDVPAQADAADNDYFLGSLAGPAPSTDVDLYRFDAAAGTLVFLGLDNDPDFDGTCTDTRLELLDASTLTLLAVNDAGAVSNDRAPAPGTQTSTAPVACAESLAHRVAASGSYLVRVAVGTGAAGDAAKGSYLLSIAPDCTALCSDGNACTVHDTCQAGACVAGTPVSCDDNNPCTDDSCDPGVGCVHQAVPSRPCEDGDPCTLGDACTASGACAGSPRDCDDGNICTADSCSASGACVHNTNNTCGGAPKGQGYWKRLCRGPVGSDRYAQADVDCVNDTCVFGSVATLAGLCARLEVTPSSDKCAQAESQLMALTLNVCRGRLLDAEPIDSQCTTNDTVGESRSDAGVLLCKSNRTFTDCVRAQCESEEINSGEALFANSLRLQRLPIGAIRLTWQAPVASEDFAAPRAYRVWRRPTSEAPYVMLGETTLFEFTDTTGGAGPTIWQYEVTMAW